MRQYRTSGTVQGAPGNRRSYCRRLGLPVQPLCLVYTPNLRNNFNYSDLCDKNNA